MIALALLYTFGQDHDQDNIYSIQNIILVISIIAALVFSLSRERRNDRKRTHQRNPSTGPDPNAIHFAAIRSRMSAKQRSVIEHREDQSMPGGERTGPQGMGPMSEWGWEQDLVAAWPVGSLVFVSAPRFRTKYLVSGWALTMADIYS